MKSRPYVLPLVLGLAALALWFATPSSRQPDTRRNAAPSPSTSSPSPVVAEPPVNTVNPAPTLAPSAAVVAPGATPPRGDASGSTVSTAGTPADTPYVPLHGGGPASQDQAAQTSVERVRHMVSDFHTLLGENPVGTNAEIMKQMMGGNPRQATLGPPEGISLNAQGELVDQWGTPYFFHQLSRDRMEVRSAGPDKIMWTADDVITR